MLQLEKKLEALNTQKDELQQQLKVQSAELAAAGSGVEAAAKVWARLS